MLIAVAADLHDNLANWRIFSDYVKKQGISTLLFCGDLCNRETLGLVADSGFEKIFMIAGNQELYGEDDIRERKNIIFLGRYGAVKIKGLSIGLIHEPHYESRLTRKHGHQDYIFYGHTHKPWLENKNGLLLVNPGTLGGVFYKASFTLLETDTGRMELKILENI